MHDQALMNALHYMNRFRKETIRMATIADFSQTIIYLPFCS
jgi:hypothetical protein